MKLSIILPQYNEDEKICANSLNALNTQLGYDFNDFEVIIVNDRSKIILSDMFIKSFANLKIRYIINKENGGPGMARQTGLDAAKGEYVTFIDIDDCFQNCNVLNFFLRSIYKDHPEIATTKWLEERENNDFLEHTSELTWMFGKFYLREFLVKNNVRFHKELRVHEDSYFNRVAISMATKAKYYDFLTYVWINSDNSITRRDNAFYGIEGYPQYIRCNDLIFDEKMSRNREQIPNDINEIFIYSYILLNNPEWFEAKAKKYKDSSEQLLSYMANKWAVEFNNFTDEKRLQIYKNHMIDMRRIPSISYVDWIKNLESINQKILPKYPFPNTKLSKVGETNDTSGNAQQT